MLLVFNLPQSAYPGRVGGQTSLIAHSGLYANNFRGERGEEIIRALSEAGNEPRHEFVMRQKWLGVLQTGL